MSKYHFQQCNKLPVFAGKSNWGQKVTYQDWISERNRLFDPNLIYQEKLEVCCIAVNSTLTFRILTPGKIEKRQKPHSLGNPSLVKVTLTIFLIPCKISKPVEPALQYHFRFLPAQIGFKRPKTQKSLLIMIESIIKNALFFTY